MGKDMSELENELAVVETDALAEEQDNAVKNYSHFKNKIAKCEKTLPYPEAVGWVRPIDNDDRQNIQYQKKRNEKYLKEIEELKGYYEDTKLYIGHIQMSSGQQYYIMEMPHDTYALDSKTTLISVDSKKYADYIKGWRYPDEDRNVSFSRNVIMQSKQVTDVDVIIDRNSGAVSEVTDKYLIKALIRNKNKKGVESIIQTIQKKQDAIRSLPADESFIVQGCAGSGKTMVLLHRLRYLLHNKEIDSSNYVFLVPGHGFKSFIKNISASFKINEKNIVPYQQYYITMSGKKADPDIEDTNELIFDPEYLAKVYSRDLITEAYETVFSEISEQTENLIVRIDKMLNDKLETNKGDLEKKLEDLDYETIEYIYAQLKKIADIFTENDPEIDNVSLFDVDKYIDLINKKYEAAKEEYKQASIEIENITIDPNDVQLLENETLCRLNREIEAERKAVGSASRFTKAAHETKLEKLQSNYEVIYKEVEEQLLEEKKKELSEKSEKYANISDNLTLEDLGIIVEDIRNTYNRYNDKYNELTDKVENIEASIMEKYESVISKLNALIESSSEFDLYSREAISKLTTIPQFYIDLLNDNSMLASAYLRECKDEEKENIKKEFSLYTRKSANEIRAAIATNILNYCTRKLKEEFSIKPDKKYKHYWYLNLYAYYLTHEDIKDKSTFVFVDETQDLSPSEIELIYKVNVTENSASEDMLIPVMNLFGDVNQTISSHGVKDWNELNVPGSPLCNKLNSSIRTLYENFRNPNQIVKYCNNEFPFSMEMVGVDMDPVTVHSTLEKLCEIQRLSSDIPLIVKDESTKKDLFIYISDLEVEPVDILTVKEVKGLEFKEVIVIDKGMTDNERYIAYTRALKKLVIIKELPEYTNKDRALYIETDSFIDTVAREMIKYEDGFEFSRQELLKLTDNSASKLFEEFTEKERVYFIKNFLNQLKFNEFNKYNKLGIHLSNFWDSINNEKFSDKERMKLRSWTCFDAIEKCFDIVDEDTLFWKNAAMHYSLLNFSYNRVNDLLVMQFCKNTILMFLDKSAAGHICIFDNDDYKKEVEKIILYGYSTFALKSKLYELCSKKNNLVNRDKNWREEINTKLSSNNILWDE